MNPQMNLQPLTNLLHQRWAEAIGWTLIHFLWQGALIAGLLALVLWGLRKRSAGGRYVVGCLCLLLMAIAPVITFSIVQGDLRPPAEHAATLEQREGGPAARLPSVAFDPSLLIEPRPMRAMAGPEPALAPAAPVAALSLTERLTSCLKPWLPAFVGLWLTGVAGLMAFHLGGYLQVQRLRRRGVRASDGLARRIFCDLLTKLKISRPVLLLESACVQVPAVIGLLRPVILLPVSALTGLSPPELEAILAHELMHIRRHDYLLNLMQIVIETLLFYHPAVWWVSNRIRQERENCCDDLASALCGDTLVYARALAKMEELRAMPGNIALAASGGVLLKRIQRLLGTEEEPTMSPSRSILAVVLVVGLLLGALGWRLAAKAEEQKAPATHPAAAQAGEPRFVDNVKFVQNHGTVMTTVPAPGQALKTGDGMSGHPGAVARVSYQFLHTSDAGDVYRFQCVFPVDGPNPQTRETEIIYAGKEVIAFEDADLRIGMRPATPEDRALGGRKGEPPAMQPANAPKASTEPVVQMSQLVYGPTIERTLLPSENGKNWALDLDSGKLFDRPHELPWELKELKAWAAANGVDLVGVDVEGFQLATADLYVNSLDRISAGDVYRQVKDRDGGTPVTLRVGRHGGSVTYGFKTREGGFGILRIIPANTDEEAGDPPSPVRIQYRMIFPLGAQPDTRSAATQPANDLSWMKLDPKNMEQFWKQAPTEAKGAYDMAHNDAELVAAEALSRNNDLLGLVVLLRSQSSAGVEKYRVSTIGQTLTGRWAFLSFFTSDNLEAAEKTFQMRKVAQAAYIQNNRASATQPATRPAATRPLGAGSRTQDEMEKIQDLAIQQETLDALREIQDRELRKLTGQGVGNSDARVVELRQSIDRYGKAIESLTEQRQRAAAPPATRPAGTRPGARAELEPWLRTHLPTVTLVPCDVAEFLHSPSGLEVSITADKTVYAEGQPILVRWTIRNTTNSDRVIVWHNRYYSPVVFDIRDSAGRLYANRSGPRDLLRLGGSTAGEPERVVLRPGEAKEMSIDLRPILGHLTGRLQVMGVYSPRDAGTLPEGVIDRYARDAVRQRIPSAPFTIEIRAAKSDAGPAATLPAKDAAR